MDNLEREQETGITIKKLQGSVENQRARKLYEEIFDEDSPAFVDYYFAVKAAENEIFAAEASSGEILATLHLNPYPVSFYGKEVATNYIVAVATKAEYRHQGWMTKLLKASLREMQKKNMPFCWLMPAAEAIYRPFGFHYIYKKNQMFFSGEAKKPDGSENLLICKEALNENLQELECFAKEELAKMADVYARHDQAYFLQRKKEMACEGGKLMLFCCDGKICGYFLAALQIREVWEVVVEEKYQKEAFYALIRWAGPEKLKISAFPKVWEVYGAVQEIPVIMARLLHLPTFVQNMKAKTERTLKIGLQDSLLEENCGKFEIHLGRTGGTVQKLPEDAEILREMDIRELTAELFEASAWFNEVV